MTECRIYDAIPEKRSSTGTLAKEHMCQCEGYKYLKGLKGKKLVFIRRTPKAYELACKGEMFVCMLEGLCDIVEALWSSSQQVFCANPNGNV